MPRLRLIDFRFSRAPKVLGFCQDDRRSAADFANSAQRRLLYAREAGDEGWWGTWVEVAWTNVSRTNPFITLPRSLARLEKMNVCQRPTVIQNQFYEYLDFGNGRLPKSCRQDRWWDCRALGLTRNNAITFADPTFKPFYIKAYASDSADADNAFKRVLVQGLDSNDSVVYSQDAEQEVQGEFIVLDSPFVQTTFLFNAISGFQKDQTSGTVQLFAVNPTTGEEELLLIMEPSETVAGYRRYYLNNLPANCCHVSSTVEPLTVTAIAKMELVPVIYDSDYLLLHNLEALIEESISLRMSEMDNVEAQKLSTIHHINAVRMLNSEITHYLGKQNPAVNFAPFGSARLECQNIGNQL